VDLRNRPKVVISAFVVLILALATGYGVFHYIQQEKKKETTASGEGSIPVQVAEAKVTKLENVLELTGEIKPGTAVDVYPKVGAEIIEKMYIETGDYVRKGDLIAVLDDDVIKAQLEEAKAGLAAAEAGLGQSEANLEVLEKDRSRIEYLYEQNAVSKQELDHINAQYKAAVESRKLAGAQIEKAKAALNQLQVLYGEYTIRSPISGFVAARYVEEGSRTSSAQPIVRISYEDELKIVCSVTEKDFPSLRKGMRADVTVDAFPGKVFKGVVSVVSPTIDPSTRTAQVEIHIPNQKHQLRSGMFARIKLYLGERKALTIPSVALNKMPGTGSYYVYVIKANKAILKNVKTGITQDNLTEITDGLTEKELVVTRGQNRLYDGASVSVEDKEGKGGYRR